MEAKGRITEYWTQHPLEGMQLGGGFCPFLFPAAEAISRMKHESGRIPLVMGSHTVVQIQKVVWEAEGVCSKGGGQ